MSIPDEIVEKAVAEANRTVHATCISDEAMRVALTAVLPDLTAAAVAGERIAGLIESREILLDMQCQHAEHSHDPRHATAATDFARAVAAVEGRIVRIEKGEG